MGLEQEGGGTRNRLNWTTVADKNRGLWLQLASRAPGRSPNRIQERPSKTQDMRSTIVAEGGEDASDLSCRKKRVAPFEKEASPGTYESTRFPAGHRGKSCTLRPIQTPRALKKRSPLQPGSKCGILLRLPALRTHAACYFDETQIRSEEKYLPNRFISQNQSTYRI
jgi:hypothetical protein